MPDENLLDLQKRAEEEGAGSVTAGEFMRAVNKSVDEGAITVGQAAMTVIGSKAEKAAFPPQNKLGEFPTEEAIASAEFSENMLKSKGPAPKHKIVSDMMKYHGTLDVASRTLEDRSKNILERVDDQMRKIVPPVVAAARKRPSSPRLEPYSPADIDRDEQDIRRALETRGLVMEKPQGSSLHHAIAEMERRGLPPDLRRFIDSEFQTFVIEHDWAGAFKGAGDFEKGDVQLPFDYCAFEFRISSMRVIVTLGPVEGKDAVHGTMWSGINGRWYVSSSGLCFKDGRLFEDELGLAGGFNPSTDILSLLSEQIRAVCIVLDAEVAEATVVRVSEKLARKWLQAGKPPMKDYHVVSLAHRHRVKAAESTEPSDRRRPRMHYRRGHWRHFTDHRTWIKWMLVGDPDLGFIDKHYRL